MSIKETSDVGNTKKRRFNTHREDANCNPSVLVTHGVITVR